MLILVSRHLLDIRMIKLSKVNSGFTLIEVLIAMIILAIGLLGLAGLQASSLRNNQNAYFRSVATQLSYNITDRIRSNQVEAKKGATTKYLMAPSSAQPKASCSTTAGCTPAEMAENDLNIWNAALNNDLPLGSGNIAYNGGVYTVTITWDENKSGGSDSGDPSFQFGFL